MLEKIRESLRAFPAFQELRIQGDEFEAAATALLKGHVFHVTGAHCLPQIVESGAILPNLNLGFRSPFSQSENSYGVKRGYICLFDFRDHNDSFIESAFGAFLWSAIEKYAHRPAFLIIDPSLYRNLINSQVAQRETGGKEVWIPYVECWYGGAIAIDAIASASIMHVERRPFDGSIGAQHAREVKSFWRKRRRDEKARRSTLDGGEGPR